MKNLGRLDVIRLLACSTLLILPAISGAQNRPPILENVAKTFGVDSWDQVQAVRYTWNLQLGTVNLSRSWEWEPKTGKVSYAGKDKEGKPVKASFVLSELNSEPANVKDEIAPAFNNDNYWVFFAFHAYWDTSATDTVQAMQKLPLGKGSGTQVVVKYPAETGGYTPGDTWELYVAPDNRVEDMVYHRGGPKKPSEVIVTWTGYKKAGPLLFSTEHRGTADGKPVHVFFTDVAVKMNGSNTWVRAQ